MGRAAFADNAVAGRSLGPSPAGECVEGRRGGGGLPILGFWMLPLGLALLAIDVPFLRRPMARLLAFINGKLAKV